MAKQTQQAADSTQQPAVKLREFDKVKEDADALVKENDTRDADFALYEEAFKLTPDTAYKAANTDLKEIFDPTPWNVIMAATKMYAVSEPSIQVLTEPIEGGSALDSAHLQKLSEARRGADKMEDFIRALRYANMSASDRDFDMDSLFSIFLYGVVNHITDSPFEEQGDRWSDEDERPPYYMWVPSAMKCYPEFGRYALQSHLYEAEVTVREIRRTYEKLAKHNKQVLAALGDDERAKKNLRDLVDDSGHYVWIDGTDDFLLAVPHGFDFVPRVARRGAAPGFFEEAEYQHMPLLYGYVKAGLYMAANILLEIEFNNTIDFANPVWAEFTEGRQPGERIDWNLRGSKVTYGKGEDIKPIYRSLVPPELTNLAAKIGQMVQDSTISRASLGAMPQGQMPAAALNLLSISSRMATFLGARAAEHAAEATYSKMFRRIKKLVPGGGVTAWGEKGAVTLKASEIAQNYRVRYKYRPDQQAERQMIAGLAAQLFNLGAGYDTYYEMLEEGGIIESAQRAFENHIERLLIEAEMPQIAKESAETARKILGAVAAVPHGPNPALPAQPALGAMPGTLPPPMPMPQVTAAQQPGLGEGATS